MAKFTKLPTDAFENIQLNAGILLSDFEPSTATIKQESILGATSGGINFTATPSYSDFGEDIDNCPKNTKELKHIESIEVKMSGTFITMKASTAKMLAGPADIDTKDATHIVPRADIVDSDFSDIWWIGDYSTKNGDKNGGYCAIHMMNGLNTGGFQIQSTDKAKGQFAFEFTGHFSISDVSKVPYEVFIKAGTEETA